MVQEAAERKNKERADVIVTFVSFASSMYVLPLYLLFSMADYIWYREHFVAFLLLRICSIGVFFVLNKIISSSTRPLPKVEKYAVIFIASCALPIQIMLAILPADSPYYVGLILIMVGVATGLRFTWSYYFICMSVIILPFLIVGILKTNELSATYFLLNSVFLLSVATICTVGRLFFERLNDREFVLRLELENEILNRDVIIDKKSSEALKLKSLSKQFSPQIIKSIIDGSLDIKADLFQSDICAIFIDIKDSTKKLITISPSQMQKVISMYVEDVMGLFLKYDITVDKFLGDGVMGFTNNPVPQDDYIERALSCAFEVLDRLQSKKAVYEDLWGGAFEVRVGISVGNATVGFYGSDLHVKSYTAIGKVINLASRINGIAPSNGIVLTQETVMALKNKQTELLSNLELIPIKSIVLKGFETEEVTLFEVRNLKSHTNIHSEDEDVCPNGHGLLFLSKNTKGVYILKCRDCEYILDGDNQDHEKRVA